ncbi:hypothetical protein CC86DRAFT_24136 [Ophiobolus disseminans]|uniref:Uncharacterized protein n=1 Tax=Ophiobolus disseminans TaxID=1469910 RepID=A0A6A7A1X4_9PLEO|nr:hypothetical protein CC86DRAFT_24136 [Ophiobolus disseminans]
MAKNTIPTAFSHANDLVPILKELDTQADVVLASIFMIQSLYQQHAKSRDTTQRSNLAVILREHRRALEADLGIIKLDAGFITDGQLETWVKAATNEAEKKAREKRLDSLMMKIANVEEAMTELREGMMGDKDCFL